MNGLVAQVVDAMVQLGAVYSSLAQLAWSEVEMSTAFWFVLKLFFFGERLNAEEIL